MKRYLYILTFISSFFFWACEEVIEIDLNGTNPLIVVEGNIAVGETAKIRLSYTTDYFTTEQTPYILDAFVTISDSNGASETLKHDEKGFYSGENLIGEENTTYTLTINIGDKTIEGSTSILSSTSLYAIQFEEAKFAHPGGNPSEEGGGNPFDGGGAPKYNMRLKITDDLSQNNYYMLQVNYSKSFIDFGKLLLQDKLYGNNKTITISPMMYSFDLGDTVNVQIYSIDLDTYTFYNQMNDVSGGAMPMQSMSTPYNPVSNMGEDVLGYFAAWAVVDTTFIITP